MTFAGDFFFNRSRYNVVQIEVSFVSTGEGKHLDSFYERCVTIKHFT